jgi:hypothetical protein
MSPIKGKAGHNRRLFDKWTNFLPIDCIRKWISKLTYNNSPVLRICISFNADPDPVFIVNADTDPDPDPRFDDQKLEKIYSWNKIYIFLIKNCNLFIPRPPKRTSNLQEKSSSLKRKHLAQKLEFSSLSAGQWMRIRIRNTEKYYYFIVNNFLVTSPISIRTETSQNFSHWYYSAMSPTKERVPGID